MAGDDTIKKCGDWSPMTRGDDCACFDAVLTTYRRMKETGVGEAHALRVAGRVLKLRHPEFSEAVAHDTVHYWTAATSDRALH